MEDNISTNGTFIFARYSVAELHGKFAPTAAAIDQVVSPILYVIGILTNPLSAHIWLSRSTRKNNSSAIYLGTLSVSHFIFLILHVFVELNYAWDVKTYNGYVSCEIFNVVYYIPQYLAPLLVLGFTVERYIAVCFPFSKEQYCSNRRAFIVIVGLICLSVFLCLIQAYFWTYDPSIKDCNHRPEAVQGGATNIIVIWTWISELLIFGIVPLSVLVFNVLVILEIRSLTASAPAYMTSGGGGGQASTITLLCVSFYLICTWLPATVVYSLQQAISIGNQYLTDEQIAEDSIWKGYFTYYIVRKIVEEITLSNNACYFFIYYTTGKHFREKTKLLLGLNKCCNRQSKNAKMATYQAVSKANITNGSTNATNV